MSSAELWLHMCHSPPAETPSETPSSACIVPNKHGTNTMLDFNARQSNCAAALSDTSSLMYRKVWPVLETGTVAMYTHGRAGFALLRSVHAAPRAAQHHATSAASNPTATPRAVAKAYTATASSSAVPTDNAAPGVFGISPSFLVHWRRSPGHFAMTGSPCFTFGST